MTEISGRFTLSLLGPFRLGTCDGARIDVASKKGQALIALLAVAGGGERTRSWLQTILWGSRGAEQAQASLRSELARLRAVLNIEGRSLIHSDKSRIWLDLAQFDVDARDITDNLPAGEFLEGLDIAGEEAFEDWLRDERARVEQRFERASEKIAPPVPQLPPKAAFAQLPALAVLPFANLGGDAALDVFAEGISEDLIDRLSRLRWLPIIARSSSFAIRKADPDPREVGAALGARYVLEGRLRATQLAVSLADCDTGQVIWSKKLAMDDASAPDALEALLTGMASTLGTRIDQEEQSRALRKPQSDLNVRDLLWRGRWHLNRFTKEDSAAAQACFAEALAREPNSPEAIIQVAWARAWDLWATRGNEEQVRGLRQLAQKAIIADCDDARGHMLAGIAEIWLLQPMRAEALLHRAIELNPSLVMAHTQLGSTLRLRGENRQAIEAFDMAVRLSPNDHDMFFIAGELAIAHLMIGDFASALDHAEHAISRRSAYWFAHVVKAIALAKLDKTEAAKRAYAELLRVKPDFDMRYLDWQPFTDPADNQFLKDEMNRIAA